MEWTVECARRDCQIGNPVVVVIAVEERRCEKEFPARFSSIETAKEGNFRLSYFVLPRIAAVVV